MDKNQLTQEPWYHLDNDANVANTLSEDNNSASIFHNLL